MKELSGFDEYVEEKMEFWQTPGLQICIVKDGEVIHSKGYGYRDPEKKLEMRSDPCTSLPRTPRPLHPCR